MDPCSPIGLAQIPVLIVPLGKVRAETWTKYSELLGSFTQLSQADIPLDANHKKSRFYPSLSSSFPTSAASSASVTATGAGLVKSNNNNTLHLTYSHSLPPLGSTESLSLIRPSVKPLIFIGIVDLHHTCTPSLPLGAHLLSNKLAELFPSNDSHPLVVKCFGVGGEDDNSRDGGPDKETTGTVGIEIGLNEVVIDGGPGEVGGNGVTVLPRLGQPRELIEAMIGELVGTLLGEFSDLAASLETPSGYAHLHQSLLPSFSVPSGPTRASSPFSRPGTAHSASVPVSHSQPHPFRSSTLNGGSTPPIFPSPSPTPPVLSNTLSSQTSQLPPFPPSFNRSVSASARTTTASPTPMTPTSEFGVGTGGGPVKTSLGGVGRKRVVSSSPSTTSQAATSLPTSSASLAPASGGGPVVGSARLNVVLASLYLLSGRLGDAIASINEALPIFNKSMTDPIWLANGLEILGSAILLLELKSKGPSSAGRAGPSLGASTSSSFSTSSGGVTTTEYAEILGNLNQAINTYHFYRTPFPASPTGARNPLPAMYTWCALRQARVLELILLSGGELGPDTVPFLFSSSSEGRAYPPSYRTTCRTKAIVAARAEISAKASVAHGPWLLGLEQKERIHVLSVLVKLMRSLGLRRKEGLYARELLACLADGVVSARSSNGGGPSSVGGSTQKAKDRAGSNLSLGEGIGVRDVMDMEGNKGIVILMERTLEGYGVGLGSSAFWEGTEKSENDKLQSVERKFVGGKEYLDEEATGKDRFGWSDLVLRVLRDGIALGEVLPDYHSVIRISTTMLRVFYPSIPPPEQNYLSQVLSRSLATAHRRGILNPESQLRFWPGWIVLSLEAGSLPTSHQPIEHAMQDREIASSSSAKGLLRDPFLFNPRSKSSGQGGTTPLVQNDNAEFFVTLRNPFGFELQIQNIRLSTFGVGFTSNPCSATIYPNSIQTFRVTGFAHSHGQLVVQGCVIRLQDGSEAEFMLPLHDAAEIKRQQKRESIRKDTERTVKLSGLNARPTERKRRESTWLANAPEKVKARMSLGEDDELANYLTCEVVPEQPLLRIRGTSLTHGAIMLYAGEESFIRITLENTSNVPVDFVKLSFQDSTTGPAQAKIAEGELSPGELHEIEADLIKRPVFNWDRSPESVKIPPRGRYTVDVGCLGKVGCTWGSIQIDYALINRSPENPSAIFHTRQITLSILMSVYNTLESTSLDILRIPSFTSSRARLTSSNLSLTERTVDLPLDRQEESSIKDGFEMKDPEDQCLVAIDIRNVYGQPFEVTLEATKVYEGRKRKSSTRLVTPGCTERVVISIPRVLLPFEQTAMPIPSLMQRQYVVSSSNATGSEDDLVRNLFWYREELLSLIKASWCEPGTSKRGTLSLRSQRLTEPMLQVLRVDEVSVSLSVVPNGRSETGLVQSTVQSNEFFDIVVNVRNRLARSISPLIHLSSLNPILASQPTWSIISPNTPTAHTSPSNLTSPYMIHSNSLMLVPPGRAIPPNSSVDTVFTVNVLTSGVADFRAAVEEIGNEASSSLTNVLKNGSGKATRRIRKEEQGLSEKEKKKRAESRKREEEVERKEVWFSDILRVDVC
ncbi:Targeting complex (TRAPP) subunit [Phaffia rhodozyma]|uniref:Targeting complex (TRAPP) subunit n=1 Tax=Phaffia rhodozyma TaxID=264483 RepID=A0A0F7SF83_PHARH|nr:Targeting complex (TRAPP) subunit [Phaffia rhodozyma]